VETQAFAGNRGAVFSSPCLLDVTRITAGLQQFDLEMVERVVPRFGMA
jgi:hypothetical protein